MRAKPRIYGIGPVFEQTTADAVTRLRERVVRAAKEWVGTPYVLGAAVKGAGVDCAQLIVCVMKESAGIMGSEHLGHIPPDWYMHAAEDMYKFRMLRYASRQDAHAWRGSSIPPGAVVLLQAAGSKLYNHGAIVTAWPLIVEAVPPCVREVDATREPHWMGQAIAVFDPFAER